MSNIKIKNLQFSYKKTQIFQGLTFSLKKDKTLSIIGASGSGKTTLLKILSGELDFLGDVRINDKKVSKIDFQKLDLDIAVVYKDYNFVCKTVKDELVYYLKKAFVQIEEVKRRIKDLNNFFDIKDLLNKSVQDLTISDRVLIKILALALLKPSYLAIDNLLTDLYPRTKVLLLNYLNSNNILLINVTSDMEEVLYTDYVLCLYDGISAIDGKTLDVLGNERILKRLGFSLPFMVDLSLQLKDYGLIDKVYLNKESMVKDLWK